MNPVPAAAPDAVRARDLGCIDGSDESEIVLDLGEMPLANSLVRPDASDAEPTYPLAVRYCGATGLLQLTVSVPPEALFSEYLYFSSYSRTILDNAGQLVERLVRERDLGPDDLVMEVASNDGYLLASYVERGVPVLGIDPAANIAATARDRGVPTLVEFFGLDVGRRLATEGQRASVIHANNVIAHVPDLVGVLGGMAEVLRDDGVAVIETPYVRELVERLEFDTVYHEHLFYYSLSAMAALLERVGLTVVDVERIPIHGGSLRIFAARAGSQPPTPAVVDLLDEERAIGLTEAEFYRDFGRRVDALIDDVRGVLRELRDDGLTVAAYGAAAKGAVMLNALGDEGRIPIWVADRNPNKQGLLMPGTHNPVVAPDRILADQPDVLFVCAWNFLDELMAQEATYLDRGGRFLVPVPEPRLIGR